jgi:UDP-N-acetylglucosamine--N-acetylmuramyl-(pentapeptide) pyrophosphoryl-undecaprenol N-acetylglucosamine transferase
VVVRARGSMRILIACGGSGGHIFPAVALAEGLKAEDKYVDILFAGSNAVLDKRIFEKERFRYVLLSANKMPYKVSLKTTAFFIKLFFDMLRCLYLLIEFRPNVVIGFGGYISGPVVFSAYLLRIPTIVHEQNVVPGRANAALFKFAQKIAVSFEETKLYIKAYADKAVFTGNPIRVSLLKDDKALNIKKMGLDSGKFTILVIGGSQGAHNLNKTFLKALSGLNRDMCSRLQIIHITGVTDYRWAEEAYKQLGLDRRVFSFIDRIEEAYSASDLVITRSGASAIFEVAYFGRPMILIPYPFAMSHQTENARFFSKNGAAIQIDEKDISPDLIKDRITDLVNDRGTLGKMSDSAKRLSVPDSSYNLAKEVFILAKNS